MKLALIQYSPLWEDKEANMSKIDKMLESIDGDEDMLVFPEMTLTGFTMESKKFAEDIDGPSVRYFMEMARIRKTNVFAGIIEEFDGLIYNTLFHFDSFGLIKARYRKVHPFSMSTEDEHFAAGEEIVVTKIDQTRIGLTICYDLRFPELYRKYTKDGVDIIINTANWPVTRVDHWKTLLKARAIENQCFIVGVNRVGDDPKLNYSGCSGIYDPLGKEIVMVEQDEIVIKVEIDISKVKETRENLPFLKDMKMI
ncbi:MAG: carbon-nitrogen family hydrolase [Bacteroidetes bacterium]|nr:carbon-nitrogen family hydrolase [Bacteroidota bacterium]